MNSYSSHYASLPPEPEPAAEPIPCEALQLVQSYQDGVRAGMAWALRQVAAGALNTPPPETASPRRESVAEAARRTRIGSRQLREAINDGRLPCQRRPGRGGHPTAWLRPADVDAFVATLAVPR